MLKTNHCLHYGVWVLLAFLLSSCKGDYFDQKEPPKVEAQEVSTDFVESENIAFYDARIRSMNRQQYVKEIVMLNFADQPWEKESLGFNQTSYVDNGKFYDQVAGDGVFTSTELFEYDDEVTYSTTEKVRSVLEQPIVDVSFRHQQALDRVMSGGELGEVQMERFIKRPGGSIGGSVTCDLTFGVCGCIADKLGICNCCCIGISNCKFKGEFKVTF